jgi:hypothetical protein
MRPILLDILFSMDVEIDFSFGCVFSLFFLVNFDLSGLIYLIAS